MRNSRAETRRLAAEGLTAAQIARRLDVSRQRIYQIAREDGVSLPRPAWDENDKRRKKSIKTRVVTGGVSKPINETTAETIAEMLVAADLMARGWQVYIPLVVHRGHDLIGLMGDRMATFEVRSAYRSTVGNGLSWNKTSSDKSEYYALVITGETVTYVPDLD